MLACVIIIITWCPWWVDGWIIHSHGRNIRIQYKRIKSLRKTSSLKRDLYEHHDTSFLFSSKQLWSSPSTWFNYISPQHCYFRQWRREVPLHIKVNLEKSLTFPAPLQSPKQQTPSLWHTHTLQSLQWTATSAVYLPTQKTFYKLNLTELRCSVPLLFFKQIPHSFNLQRFAQWYEHLSWPLSIWNF